MGQPGVLRKLWFSAACAYVAALGLVLFLIIDLESGRHGTLAVTAVAVAHEDASALELTLTGTGFDADLRAIAVPVPDRMNYPDFLKGHLLKSLWSDGETLLVAFEGTRLLYVQVGDELRVTGSVSLPGKADHVVKVGQRALISVRKQGLFLIDLTDPEKPRLDHQLTSVVTHVAEMIADDGRVYIADRDGWLHVVDLRRSLPTLVSLELVEPVWRISLHGQRLLSGSLDGKLRLFELDSAGLPSQVGALQFAAGIRGLGLTEKGLFVALDNGEIQTFGLRDWPRPQRCGRLLLNGEVLQLRVVPGAPLVLLSRSQLGLLTVDVGELEEPRVAASFTHPNTPLDFRLAGSRVFAVSSAGLAMLPLADVLAGTTDEVLEPASGLFRVYEWHDELLLWAEPHGDHKHERAGHLSRLARPSARRAAAPRVWREPVPAELPPEPPCLAVLELGTARAIHLFCREDTDAAPRLESSIVLPEKQAESLWVEDLVFSVGYSGVLRIFDATRRRQPVPVGQLELPGELYACAWLEPHFLLIAAGSAGMHVVNVEDPAQPRHIAQLGLPEHLQKIAQTRDVLVYGQQAFLAHGRGGVSLVDLREASRPYSLQAIDMPGYVADITIADDLLFASTHRQGVFLVDLRNAETWLPVGPIETPLRVNAVISGEDRLVFSGRSSGIAQAAMPRRLEVKVAGGGLARIRLSAASTAKNTRLYIYNKDERLSVPIPATADRRVAQKE